MFCKLCSKNFQPNPTSRNPTYCSIPCRQKGISISTAKIRGDKMRDRGLCKSYRKREGRHEHRIVAENMIGRSLKKGEIVHHINGNRRDNRKENLVVITQSQHASYHSTKNRKCEVIHCNRKHVAKGKCGMHYQRNQHGTL